VDIDVFGGGDLNAGETVCILVCRGPSYKRL